ncbi:MAG: site-specific integrase, partial [Candidatus Tectimicrobiota bacterium]
MPGKHATILSPAQEKAILSSLATTRSPAQDRVLLLLSLQAGLRAKEIADLTWAMVTEASGQVGDALHLPNR